MDRDDFEPEGRPVCSDCGGYTEPDLSDMGHDFDFDRCTCDEAARSVAVEGLFSPIKDVRDLGYVGEDEKVA
jgi:hypothetical protein